jgi:hypothetical protein
MGQGCRSITGLLVIFSDGVFAIAVTPLALQLRPPSLGTATTAGAVLHALARESRQFGFYVLAAYSGSSASADAAVATAGSAQPMDGQRSGCHRRLGLCSCHVV